MIFHMLSSIAINKRSYVLQFCGLHINNSFAWLQILPLDNKDMCSKTIRTLQIINYWYYTIIAKNGASQSAANKTIKIKLIFI